MSLINKTRHIFLKLFGFLVPNSLKHRLYLPAVCVLVVRHDGKVLAVSRKNDPTAFGLPGGKVDLNWYGKPIETFEEAIRRETKEETGLNLNQVCIIHAGSAENEFWTVCYVSTVSGEINTSESGRVDWIDWKTLLAGPFGVYNKKVKSIYDSFCGVKLGCK